MRNNVALRSPTYSFSGRRFPRVPHTGRHPGMASVFVLRDLGIPVFDVDVPGETRTGVRDHLM